MLLIKDITNYLETIAPLAIQESYDNSGLLTGTKSWEVKGSLITLDVTEEVIDEAISNKANLIIAHHPFIFSGLKKINGKNWVERTLIKAIKNDIAVYAIHTNLDNVQSGVNNMICEKLGLKDCRILQTKNGLLKKLVTYCPVNKAEMVRGALFSAGAGNIGDYSECSFNIIGEGTFTPSGNTKAYVGIVGQRHLEQEVRIEVVYPIHLQAAVLTSLIMSHPYEEVAYDIIPLGNSWQQTGAGMIGKLDEGIEEKKFLQLLKETFKTGTIKHTSMRGERIKYVAVCGGSGSFLLEDAIDSNADIFITADFKYHQFFDADNKIVIADIGHYESEQFTKELIYNLLKKKFITFAPHLSKVNTNPIKYF